jgi:hypothetical protein
MHRVCYIAAEKMVHVYFSWAKISSDPYAISDHQSFFHYSSKVLHKKYNLLTMVILKKIIIKIHIPE